MSKFDAVLKSRRKPEPEPTPGPTPAPASGEKRGPGRPRTGKRSNPDYEQVTVYLRKETHRRVKLALMQQPQPQEFSELVETLLSEWLQTRT